MTTTEKYYADIEAHMMMLQSLKDSIEKLHIEYTKYLCREVGTDAITEACREDLETVYEVIETLEEQRMKLYKMLYGWRM